MSYHSYPNGNSSGKGYVAAMTPFGAAIVYADCFNGITSFGAISRHGNAYSGRIGEHWYPFLAELSERFGLPVLVHSGRRDLDGLCDERAELIGADEIRADLAVWRECRVAAEAERAAEKRTEIIAQIEAREISIAAMIASSTGTATDKRDAETLARHGDWALCEDRQARSLPALPSARIVGGTRRRRNARRRVAS